MENKDENTSKDYPKWFVAVIQIGACLLTFFNICLFINPRGIMVNNVLEKVIEISPLKEAYTMMIYILFSFPAFLVAGFWTLIFLGLIYSKLTK